MSELILDDQENTPLKIKRGQSLRDFKVLWSFIRPYRKLLSLCVFFFAIDLAANLSIPKLMGLVVDRGLRPPIDFWPNFYLFLVAVGTMIIFNLVQKIIFIQVGEKALKSIRMEVYELLQRAPLKFFDSNSSGKIISRTVNDVSNVSILFNAKFFAMLSDSVLVVGAMTSLIIIKPYFGLGVLVIIVALILFLVRFLEMYSNRMHKFRSMNSTLNSFVADTMNGLEVIFAGQYHRFWIPRAQRLVNLFKVSAENVILGWAQFPMAHTFSLGLVYGLLIVTCGQDLKNGTLTGGEFLSLLTYILYLFNPFFEVSQKISEFQAAMTSMNKVNQILSLKGQLEIDSSIGETLMNPMDDIQFTNLDFGYNHQHLLFNNLNITIPGGKISALIGRTGSGKTSFIGLLSKLYPYKNGSLKIGQQELSQISRNSLYHSLGVVTQQLFLFEDSIRENLRLYDQSITDQGIWDVLKQIQVDKKINQLPKKLDTVYEKNNDPFSVGERQLLIMARMLLKDPKILIFDEATASLDNHSEYLVQLAMKKLFRGRTVIIIAHRLSTIELAENIVVLDHGKIIEQGAPKKLKSMDGAYANYLKFIGT